MKKFNLIKTVVVLFAVVAFSSCEEDGAIQFIVVDEFTTSVNIKGLAAESSFTENSSTNIGDLLDGAATFVEADIESVTLELQDDFSGTSINGNMNITVGSIVLFDQDVTLTKGGSLVIQVPANASNILSVISANAVPVSVTGTSTSGVLGDDDFTIDVLFKIRATVE
ncbi:MULTISPECIES: hypothetical protein [unclassified Polaribacter]|uniref:hypothetical protein n=1 Tax=unclassified Polaribacter TaxID=196858 RepID=UPI0011BDD8AB|nr:MULTISPECIES: hypothetical protein [unclassified Polaribacter]TXD53305.1 hypothetical protein ES043_04645 [Polaribacter sp. IC063]TXD60242.1 hypothetical protein ES044_08010 [Polaribacter sp. IC066]